MIIYCKVNITQQVVLYVENKELIVSLSSILIGDYGIILVLVAIVKRVRQIEIHLKEDN